MPQVQCNGDPAELIDIWTPLCAGEDLPPPEAERPVPGEGPTPEASTSGRDHASFLQVSGCNLYLILTLNVVAPEASTSGREHASFLQVSDWGVYGYAVRGNHYREYKEHTWMHEH